MLRVRGAGSSSARVRRMMIGLQVEFLSVVSRMAFEHLIVIYVLEAAAVAVYCAVGLATGRTFD